MNDTLVNDKSIFSSYRSKGNTRAYRKRKSVSSPNGRHALVNATHWEKEISYYYYRSVSRLDLQFYSLLSFFFLSLPEFLPFPIVHVTCCLLLRLSFFLFYSHHAKIVRWLKKKRKETSILSEIFSSLH